MAPRIVCRQSAENTSRLFPQHLHGIISRAGLRRGGGAHLSGSVIEATIKLGACSWRSSTLPAVRDRGPKAIDQSSLHQRFAEVAPHPQAQHTLPDALVGIGRNEYCRDRLSSFDEMLVKLHAGH